MATAQGGLPAAACRRAREYVACASRSTDKLHDLRSITIDLENLGEARMDTIQCRRRWAGLAPPLAARDLRDLAPAGSRNLPEYRRLVQAVFGSEEQ